MSKCRICKLGWQKRKELEYEYLEGRVSKNELGRRYGVSIDTIRRHFNRHMAPKLVEAHEKRGMVHAENLSKQITELIDDAKQIFFEARQKKQNALALKSIDSQRNVFDLLLKISSELRKREELKFEQNKHNELVDSGEEINQGLQKLTPKEQHVYFQLLNKMMSNNPESIVITGYEDFSDVVGLTDDVVIEEAEEVEEETNERPKLKRTTDPYHQYRYKPLDDLDEPVERKERLSSSEKRKRDRSILKRIRRI